MRALEEAGYFSDIPLDFEVEMARRVMTVQEILDLRSGSLIGMPRSAGENMDIRLGGTLLGSGEVVIIESMMGIRITGFAGEE